MPVSTNSPPTPSNVRIIASGSISYTCTAGATFYNAVTLNLPVITDRKLYAFITYEGAGNFARGGLGITSAADGDIATCSAVATANGGCVDVELMQSLITPTTCNLIKRVAAATGAVTQTYVNNLAKDLSTAKTGYITVANDNAGGVVKITYCIYYITN